MKGIFFSSYLDCATYLNKQQVIYWTLDGMGVIVLQMFTRQPPFFFAFPYIFHWVQTITQCHHRIANRYVRSQFMLEERILHMGSMWATDVLAFERVFFFHLQDGSGSTNTNSRSDLGNKTSWLGLGKDPGQCLLVGSHWTKKSIIQMKHLFMKLQVTRHSIWRRTEGASQRQTWISTNPELRTTYIYIRILLNIWT